MTEMRAYSVADRLFDSAERESSIGPAQIEVDDAKAWVPELRGKSIKELEDMLYDPRGAITILAKSIKHLDRNHSLLYQFSRADSDDLKAQLVGEMNDYKDTAGEHLRGGDWIDFGKESYHIVREFIRTRSAWESPPPPPIEYYEMH